MLSEHAVEVTEQRRLRSAPSAMRSSIRRPLARRIALADVGACSSSTPGPGASGQHQRIGIARALAVDPKTVHSPVLGMQVASPGHWTGA